MKQGSMLFSSLRRVVSLKNTPYRYFSATLYKGKPYYDVVVSGKSF